VTPARPGVRLRLRGSRFARLAGTVTAAAGLAAAGVAGLGDAAIAAGSTPAYAQGLDVLPFPDTPDAAPGTNIDFPTVSPSEIGAVRVVGSRSGAHSGRLSAQPSGQGTAFSPSRPFAPGEHVSVSAVLRSGAAAAAAGAPGARELRFSFSVASASGSADSARPAAPQRTAATARRTRDYISAPSLHPPIVNMSGRDTDTASGNIFLDAQKDGHPGTYILDAKGDLRWFHPSPSNSEFNLRVQGYHGQPVLTYWQGSLNSVGLGDGKGEILNENYQTTHTVTAGNGLQSRGIDEHEFTLGHEGSEGTAFVEVWKPTQTNLSSVGGPPNGTVIDWIIQEIDVATNKVIWEWHALGHIPISRSYARYSSGQPFDYFHLNSIQQLSDGHLIISARNTWAVYSIDKRTGKVVWQLGGKHSSFRRGAGANFESQHDATLHSNGLVTVFDDAAPPPREKQSRALEIHISLAKHQATLVQQFMHSPPTLAYSQGSVEVLNNHNVFVGWGSRPFFSEYTASGRRVFGASFPVGVQSYRAYRFTNWVGSPLGPPAIAIRAASTAGRDNVYASWNGSTRVAKWQVLASSSKTGSFRKLGSPSGWSSFETRIQVSRANYFKVEALDSSGHVLPHGVSTVVAGP
jgi:hypothetical protein